MVRDDLRRAHGAAGRGLAGHRGRAPHADPGPHRARARPSPRSCGGSTGWCTTPPPDDREHRTRLLYISPLRALAVDVEKNLRAPLPGHRPRGRAPRASPFRCRRSWACAPATRPADERRQLLRHPPDLLITTPESLYLMLTSQARETLRRGRGGDHRRDPRPRRHQAGRAPGAHPRAARRASPTGPPQRIGLSATQRPLDEIARFLGGHDGATRRSPGPVTIVDAGVRKPLDLEVVVPVEDMGALGEVIDEPVERPGRRRPGAALASGRRCTPGCSSWSQEHRSTHHLRQRPPPGRAPGHPAQRAAPRGREPRRPRPTGTLARAPGHELVKAHHGSLSRERRLHHRGRAQAGRAQGPGRHLVARARHRHGRGRPRHPGRVAGRGEPRPAAHRPGRPPGRRAQPGQALPQAPQRPASRRRSSSSACTQGLIEHTRYPRNPLDVLAQQIVAMVRAGRLVGRRPRRASSASAPTSPSCPTRSWHNVLDLLAGRYPSEEFGELRPRIVWDRVDGVVRGPGRRPAPRRHQRRHHPRPRPVRRVPARRHPGGRARRGDGLREPARARPSCSAPPPGASRTSPTSGSSSPPRPGQPGQDAVLARRRPGSPARAGPGHRRVRPRDPRRCRRTRRSARLQRPPRPRPAGRRRTCSPTSTSRPRPPAASCPTTARSSSSASATRSATGGSASSRRSAPRCTPRGPWPCRPGWPSEWGVDVELMWSDDGIVMRLPEAVDDFPIEELLDRPRRDRRARHRPAAEHRHVRRPLPRVRRPGPCCCPAAAPTGAPRCGSSARRPPTCSRWPPATPTSRSCSRPPASASTTSSTCRRCARCSPTCGPGEIRVVAGRHPPGVAVRPVAAVRLDRRLHVRGRRPAGRAPGRRPGARPRPAARAARRRGAPGAARPRRARRPRARAAAPRPTAAGPGRRRAPRPAARASGRSTREVEARRPRDGRRRRRSSAAWLDALVARAAGHRGRRGRARSASPPPRTPPACATRSACALPAGLPAGVHRPGAPIRWSTSSPATPAPTARSSPRRSPRRSGVGVDRVRPRARAPRGRRPGRAGRVPARRRRARVVRRRRPAPAPAPVARRAAPRGRAGRGARPWPASCPAWQGVGSPRRGLDALVEVVGALQGAALPASVARDRRAAGPGGRLPPGRPRRPAAPRARWCGSAPAPLGAGDGRVRLRVPRPGRPAASPDPGRRSARTRRRSTTPLRAHLAERGRLVLARPRRRPAAGRRRRPTTTPTVLGRAVGPGVGGRGHQRLARPAAGARGVGRAAAASAAGGRPRGREPGAAPDLRPLTRLGPARRPPAGGRWSPRCSSPGRAATEAAHARALQLLERYGVLTREAVLAEGVEGGFAGVYPVLKALEERGQVRRGYFVAGLGGAQFALPGAVDRLRARRVRERHRPTTPPPLVLAATDPAQPYGAALPWPESAGPAARAAGAYVVLHRGRPIGVPRTGRSTASRCSTVPPTTPLDRRHGPTRRHQASQEDRGGEDRLAAAGGSPGPSETSCWRTGSSRATRGRHCGSSE